MKRKMLKIIQILVGNLFITFGYSFITIPNQIITGGITGASMIISKLTPLSVSLAANFLTITLLVLCLVFLGKNYFVNSLISSVFYMSLLNIFNSLNIHINLGPILNVGIAGFLVGIGYKLCIDAEASTAGFDVVALIINKYHPLINVGTAIRYISIMIMLLGLFQFGLFSVILGIALIVIQTSVLNQMEGKVLSFF